MGFDLDIRPMRNDNRESDTDVDSPTYSHELTLQLIELFRGQDILKVENIFFNDPEIRIQGLRPEVGHSNHFHIRFLPPSR